MPKNDVQLLQEVSDKLSSSYARMADLIDKQAEATMYLVEVATALRTANETNGIPTPESAIPLANTSRQ